MGYIAVASLVHLVCTSICVWLATKFSFIELQMKQIVFIVVVVTGLALLPSVGFLLSLVLFIVLVMRLSGCTAFDAAAVAIFTMMFVVFSIFFILGALSS